MTFSAGVGANIAGTFKLGFDADGNGTIDATTETTADISFDENNWASLDPTLNNSQLIQDALQKLGTDQNIAALQNVVVTATDAHNYLVDFGGVSQDQQLGITQPLLKIPLADANWTSGNLPAVGVLDLTNLQYSTATSVRNPFTVGADTLGMPNIYISPTDPLQTANSIEQAFALTAQYHTIAAVDVQYPDVIATFLSAFPSVKVRPVVKSDGTYDPYSFDITFTGDSGKQNQPELILGLIQDAQNNLIIGGGSVSTIKQSSDVFRVNPEEPDNIYTPLPDKYNQVNPAVAMDADGDFVITWESQVPDSVTQGSKTDIFARRFSPVGIVPLANVSFYADMNLDGVAETPIQGVRALKAPTDPSLTLVDQYTFRVNTFTTNSQFNPSVAMDEFGNFVISWTNEGQLASYFNNISARRFARDGTPQVNPVTNNKAEWAVTNTSSVNNELSYVAMSEDGHFLVTWTRDSYSNPLPQPWGIRVGGNVRAEVYNADGSILDADFSVGGGGYSTAAFDRSNRFTVSWTVSGYDNDTIAYAVTPPSTYAREFDIQGIFPGVPTEIRAEFRVSSALFNPGTTVERWSGYQGFSSVGMDADGDLVITYEGNGPDVVQDSSLGGLDTLIDNAVANYLAGGATNEQAGVYRAYLEAAYEIYRGEANGIMFSDFNTDPQSALNNLFVVSRDAIVNAQRDGNDARWVLDIDGDATSGGFTMRLTSPEVAGFVDMGITVAYLPNNGPVNAADTLTNIQDTLRANQPFGRKLGKKCRIWTGVRISSCLRHCRPHRFRDRFPGRRARDGGINFGDAAFRHEKAGSKR